MAESLIEAEKQGVDMAESLIKAEKPGVGMAESLIEAEKQGVDMAELLIEAEKQAADMAEVLIEAEKQAIDMAESQKALEKEEPQTEEGERPEEVVAEKQESSLRHQDHRVADQDSEPAQLSHIRTLKLEIRQVRQAIADLNRDFARNCRSAVLTDVRPAIQQQNRELVELRREVNQWRNECLKLKKLLCSQRKTAAHGLVQDGSSWRSVDQQKSRAKKMDVKVTKDQRDEKSSKRNEVQTDVSEKKVDPRQHERRDQADLHEQLQQNTHTQQRELPQSSSPRQHERQVSMSPLHERPLSTSPQLERPLSTSPLHERPLSTSPQLERPLSSSPQYERPLSTSPHYERPLSTSPECERSLSTSPQPELLGSNSPQHPSYQKKRTRKKVKVGQQQKTQSTQNVEHQKQQPQHQRQQDQQQSQQEDELGTSKSTLRSPPSSPPATSDVETLPEDGSLFEVKNVSRYVSEGLRMITPFYRLTGSSKLVRLSLWFNCEGILNAQLIISGLSSQASTISERLTVMGEIKNTSRFFSQFFVGTRVIQGQQGSRWIEKCTTSVELMTARKKYSNVTFENLKRMNFVYKDSIIIRWAVKTEVVEENTPL